MTLSLDLILDLALLGTAVAIVAFLLPFVYLRNFGVAFVVGVLVSLFNTAIMWGLGQLGISFQPNMLTLAHLVLTTVSLLLADKLLGGFRLRSFWGAMVFALLVILLDLGLNQLLNAVF